MLLCVLMQWGPHITHALTRMEIPCAWMTSTYVCTWPRSISHLEVLELVVSLPFALFPPRNNQWDGASGSERGTFPYPQTGNTGRVLGM